VQVRSCKTIAVAAAVGILSEKFIPPTIQATNGRELRAHTHTHTHTQERTPNVLYYTNVCVCLYCYYYIINIYYIYMFIIYELCLFVCVRMCTCVRVYNRDCSTSTGILLYYISTMTTRIMQLESPSTKKIYTNYNLQQLLKKYFGTLNMWRKMYVGRCILECDEYIIVYGLLKLYCVYHNI